MKARARFPTLSHHITNHPEFIDTVYDTAIDSRIGVTTGDTQRQYDLTMYRSNEYMTAKEYFERGVRTEYFGEESRGWEEEERGGTGRGKYVRPLRRMRKVEEGGRRRRCEHRSGSPVAVFNDGSCVVFDKCFICMDAAGDRMVFPCRHTNMCSDCVARLKQCPLCRAPIAYVNPRFPISNSV